MYEFDRTKARRQDKQRYGVYPRTGLLYPSNVVKLPQDSILTAQHRGQVYLRRVFPDKVLLIYSECKNERDRGCNSGDRSRPRPADVALSPKYCNSIVYVTQLAHEATPSQGRVDESNMILHQ